MKEPKTTAIDEFTTRLVPGMLIRDETDGEEFRVLFAQKGSRDGVVHCMDEYGHESLEEVYDGNHVIVHEGSPKVRVAYGLTPHGSIRVSKGYYWNEDDFKRRHSVAHWHYVEALKGTERIIPDKTVVRENAQ